LRVLIYIYRFSVIRRCVEFVYIYIGTYILLFVGMIYMIMCIRVWCIELCTYFVPDDYYYCCAQTSKFTKRRVCVFVIDFRLRTI